ncbi:hypothetical protein [Niallia taxi]|uniref:hypothetical protein n=1 Tax=Niallia taxi TaxID=2499688 RepID=UPI003D2D08BC
MEQKTGLKNIYKKTLAISLIKLGHDLSHTMRNRNNPKYQVFVLHDTPKLREDMAKLSNRKYEESLYSSSSERLMRYKV